MTSRLDRIATRQRTSRVRDLVFAAFLGLAAIVSITSVQHVVTQSQNHVAQR
jgi:hypothetical protein